MEKLFSPALKLDCYWFSCMYLVRTLIIIIVTIRNIIYLFVLEEYLAPLQRGHKSSNAINFGNVVAEQ